ncbi:MAG: hypothetical protein JW885_02890 [Deltaproteobacteria bacterium]|nr:hypothetical protein [Candidatus Zymogenaceae bacterium]
METTVANRAIEAHEIFQKLIGVITDRNRNVFMIGAYLKEIRDGELFRALGYDSFAEFCASPEISFQKSTAYNFIGLHEKFILELGLSFQEIGNIPYSKLVIIMGLATAENVHDLLTLARELAMGDLNEELEFKGYRTDADGTPVEYRSRGMKLFEKYTKLPLADRAEFDREWRRFNMVEGAGG